MELKHLFCKIVADIWQRLLIVPYGIETGDKERDITWRTNLLIVPYGIETELQETNKARNSTFNRTLWNWNDVA